MERAWNLECVTLDVSTSSPVNFRSVTKPLRAEGIYPNNTWLKGFEKL